MHAVVPASDSLAASPMEHATAPPGKAGNPEPRALNRAPSSSYWGISESALQFVIYEHLKKNMRATASAGQTGNR